jgi:hypothetical protein
MPDTNVVRLPGHPVLANEPAASLGEGGCLLAFGLPFVAAGAYLAWVTRFHPEQLFFSGPVMPTKLIYAFAGLFVASGAILWSTALRAMGAGFARARRARSYPHTPWLADRAWDVKGERQRPWAGAMSSFTLIGFLALFLLPFHWWMYADTWIPGVLILALFDLVFLAFLTYWLYAVARSLKYGRAWVGYDRFPYFLGEPLDLRLGCRGGLDRFTKLTVTIRFVRVKNEVQGRNRQAVCHQHWAEEMAFDPGLLRGATALPISLVLPAGDYANALSADPPRYWEIEAKGEAPGIDFLALFLLPVYARP